MMPQRAEQPGCQESVPSPTQEMQDMRGLGSFQMVWDVEVIRPHTIVAVRKAGVFSDQFDVLVDGEPVLSESVGIHNLKGNTVIHIDDTPIGVSWKWGFLSGSPESIVFTHDGRELATYDGKSQPALDVEVGKVLPPHQVAASQPSANQFQLANARAQAEKRLRSGAGWFYWIAGLSFVNSLVFWFGGRTSFLAGLGITQVVDAFLSVLATEMGMEGNATITVAALVLDALGAGVFVVLGYLASKRFRWSFIAGMIVYALDAAILLAFSDFLGTGFHAFALFGLYGGIKALKQLAALQESTAAPG
jgi:hypothetical protein